MADFETTRGSAALPTAADAARVTAFLRMVYGWMCGGLGITAFVAFTVTGSPALVRTIASNATTFVVTAGMFGALALFGTTTKRSLAGAGHFFFMGLIGLILASVVGIFWHSEALQLLISVVGVIVFTGLTAWDA